MFFGDKRRTMMTCSQAAVVVPLSIKDSFPCVFDELTTGSFCNAFKISLSITNPFSDISGNTARPASVIHPSRSILRHLSLFSSDQLLLVFRGHSFCAVVCSSIFLVVLSIQPKHMASSSASIYQKVPSSLGLPLFTTTQHSVSVLWF